MQAACLVAFGVRHTRLGAVDCLPFQAKASFLAAILHLLVAGAA